MDRGNEQLLRAVTDAVDEALVVWGHDGEPLHVNPPAARLLAQLSAAAEEHIEDTGEARAPMPPSSPSLSWPPAMRDRATTGVSRVLTEGAFDSWGETPTSDALPGPVHVTLSPLRSDEQASTVIGVLGRLQPSWVGVSSHEPSRSDTRSIEELERLLTERTAEVNQLVHAVSHDLQEPLRAIVGFSELLAKRYQGQLDAKADEFLGFVIEGTVRMQQQISGLLAYSRVQTHGAEFGVVDLDAALQAACTRLGAIIAEHGAEITAVDLPNVYGDERQLTSLLQQLLDNAIKYRSDDPPMITASGERHDEEWRVTVADNGQGIAPEQAERVFHIFQRLHPRTDEYPGIGAGLAVSRRIVERHGGQIGVEPRSGGGSVFWFTLPVAEERES